MEAILGPDYAGYDSASSRSPWCFHKDFFCLEGGPREKRSGPDKKKHLETCLLFGIRWIISLCLDYDWLFLGSPR
jgi:hypothetical protein